MEETKQTLYTGALNTSETDLLNKVLDGTFDSIQKEGEPDKDKPVEENVEEIVENGVASPVQEEGGEVTNEPDPVLGTYKSVEDLAQGKRHADEYILEQKQALEAKEAEIEKLKTQSQTFLTQQQLLNQNPTPKEEETPSMSKEEFNEATAEAFENDPAATIKSFVEDAVKPVQAELDRIKNEGVESKKLEQQEQFQRISKNNIDQIAPEFPGSLERVNPGNLLNFSKYLSSFNASVGQLAHDPIKFRQMYKSFYETHNTPVGELPVISKASVVSSKSIKRSQVAGVVSGSPSGDDNPKPKDANHDFLSDMHVHMQKKSNAGFYKKIK